MFEGLLAQKRRLGNNRLVGVGSQVGFNSTLILMVVMMMMMTPHSMRVRLDVASGLNGFSIQVQFTKRLSKPGMWLKAPRTAVWQAAPGPVTLAKFSTKPPLPTFISMERDCECLYYYGSTVPYSKLRGSSLWSGNVAVSMQAVSQGLLKSEMPLAADI
jgi:hypothetical protein